MALKTKIEWCDATWNPVNGCAPVSPGCANCYASALSVRWGKPAYGVNRERTLASKGTLRLPYRLNHRAKDRPTRLFTASLSDVFDPVWPVDGHIRLLAAIEKCRQVNFILVTKRPELWRTVLERVTSSPASRLPEVLPAAEFAQSWLDGKAPDNVCVMASVEDQSYGAGPHPAASLADVIWPDAQFLTRQGAGAAATRVLKRLGCYWVCRNVKGDRIAGWIISLAPFAFAATMTHAEAIMEERRGAMWYTIGFRFKTERMM